MRCRFPSTNDPNPFFIFATGVGMHNQQYRDSLNHPDRVPSLLTIFKPVRHDEMERIIEHLSCKIKGDAVLGKIAPRFFRIPFKLQSSTIDYSIVCTNP
ncbi:hypothetical protein X734_18335 [Mesorhizobium sp. L2C084A000]|nr:hypothetical protein X734_18335 [Mesorhizobium sp. L2C084A000]